MRADVVGRAMRLIADGVVDREGVGGLAARLGYSERHINRLLTAELGAGPLALARAQRAQTARQLIETTAMPITQTSRSRPGSPASASSTTPSARCSRRRRPSCAPAPRQAAAPPGGTLVAAPAVPRAVPRRVDLFAFLGDRAVPGVEDVGRRDVPPHRCACRTATRVVGPVARAECAGPTCRVHAAPRRPARPQRRGAALPAAARPRRRPGRRRRTLRRRPAARAAGSQAARPARRRVVADGVELLVARGARPAGVGRRARAPSPARLVAAVGQPLAAAGRRRRPTPFPSAAAIAGCSTDRLAMPRRERHEHWSSAC